MIFSKTNINGVLLVVPQRREDDRGYFARTFCRDEFADRGLTDFAQCSVSFNLRKGTVRGMHFQRAPHAETKLVRCVRGAVFDVVVDLRPLSPTFRQWLGFELDAANGYALYVPQDVAHGFQTLQDETEVFYMISPAYTPGRGAGLRFDDPAISIGWPLPVSVIADADRSWPLLADWRP
ncbi:dTDP-4-dehydrorhamnose 3,5-epimerase [Methylocella silvestris]|uniref:dTDP-4-dehydrorhamnose 3,5-epimerase n=1 Tax=Methylocella silvestris TaxID=199596 RepID=A0A2J7TE30_METSI|nr:dTDP-4-dehydrorhamnose 3,5-epimerase [Methylocella silvestris]PNG25024.1 dTDP-4-dehydrorhamnose 3,5-epimerase [Methylocella silvestris]